MLWACLALVLVAGAVSAPLTELMRRVGLRRGAMDSAGRPGQIKDGVRRVPNTGGTAIYLGIALPMLLGMLAVALAPSLISSALPALDKHLPGLAARIPDAVVFLGGLSVLHVLGIIDDRRNLGPWVKLAVMLAVAGACAALTGTRLLTALDAHAGGPWLSLLLTVLWLGVITNAMNFMDNMDGLAGGVTLVAGAFFLAASLVQGQWFVAASLALVCGAAAGFLTQNFPWRQGPEGGARIFMGDAGSLVLGFALGFLTVRITFVGAELPDAPGSLGSAWYGLFMPAVVLAVPLYDFASVTIIRLRQGRSPFVGDTQHLSHRLVRLGLSRRGSVLTIYALTASTAVGGIALASLQPWQAGLVGLQTALILAVIATLEAAAARARARAADAPRPGEQS